MPSIVDWIIPLLLATAALSAAAMVFAPLVFSVLEIFAPEERDEKDRPGQEGGAE